MNQWNPSPHLSTEQAGIENNSLIKEIPEAMLSISVSENYRVILRIESTSLSFLVTFYNFSFPFP